MHLAMTRTASKLHLLLVVCTAVEIAGGQLTNSWPQDYPGKPTGDFSPEWQSYFQVTEQLPGVTFPIARNWAGNIPVDRPGHPNNTLFFWGFEKDNGSLTANAGDKSDEPWGIWLNGGPGSSSMLGLFFENGPLHAAEDSSIYSNNFSWHQLADYFWIDQPVGTGWSTSDADGYVVDEDQVGRDFFGFLANLVKVFPSLRTRPLYLTGESYAGTYIPYITKTYFGLSSPPVKLAKIAIGDGTIGSSVEYGQLPTLTIIETYPQLIGYDTAVYEYFRDQTHLCGYDLNLTYPQNSYFPTINAPLPEHYIFGETALRQAKRDAVSKALRNDHFDRRHGLSERNLDEHTVRRLQKRDEWKRDLSGRVNGTIDPYYKCDLHEEMIDYALNFSIPWKGHNAGIGFDVYNIPDALEPQVPMDASTFLNNEATRAAIHAPTSKNWQNSIAYPFNSTDGGDDSSVEPMAFLNDLATNATRNNVGVVIYSGNDDTVVPHIASQVIIQNTTFGGIQGFTRPPSTPWFDDSGEFAGIVHQERNWTYVLVKGAGHLIPQQQPGRAFVVAREFILGHNQTGLVTELSGSVTVVGGETTTLALPVMPGQAGIYVGSGTTQSTFTYPSATIAAWDSFISTAIGAAPTASGAGSGEGGGTSSSQTHSNNAEGLHVHWLVLFTSLLIVAFSFLMY